MNSVNQDSQRPRGYKVDYGSTPPPRIAIPRLLGGTRIKPASLWEQWQDAAAA